jgi:hypothetical protein
MGGRWYRRAACARREPASRFSSTICANTICASRLVAASLALLAAGCTTDGLTTGSITPVVATSGAPVNVAFERIDGPPEPVFRKLVQDLSEEAQARQLAVVSREASARYRIRGYVAARLHDNHTTISWMWDVYDANENRALRISGEEDTDRAGKDGWADPDDQVYRRISHASIERIAGFLAAPRGPAVPMLTIAGNGDDFSPESAGIYRTADTVDPDPSGTPTPPAGPPQTRSASVISR